MFYDIGDDDDLYKYGVECGEETQAPEYGIDINEQFDKTDITSLAFELNDMLTEKLMAEPDSANYSAAIEGYNNYLEITALNKKSYWSVSAQLSYYKLCFYANRLSIDTLSEKVADFICKADEGGLTGDDAQAMFDSYI